MNPPKHPLYFIAILPNPEITKEIRKLKEYIRDEFDVKHALKLPAHITIQIPFRLPEDRESELIHIIEDFARRQKKFQVKLDGFGRFSKNVIFVKVVEHQIFKYLHAELQERVDSFITLKSHEKSSKIHPHLTIAVRDLKRTNFPAIWEKFEMQEYQNSFEANNMVLLKHNGEIWDVLQHFKFS